MSLKSTAVDLKQKAVDVVNDVRLHWKKPAKGNYVPYKEIVSYGVGGMGKEFVGNLTGLFGLSATNTLMALTLHIRPMHLYYMSIILTVLSILWSFLRGKIVDNTRTKWGRFRPYILLAGFPVVAMCVAFLFMPFDNMPYLTKLIFILGFVAVQSFLLGFYTDTYTELRTVMSPNSVERSKIISIQSIILSLAPTLTGFFIPFLANMIPGNYTNINMYRWIIVPIAIVGVVLSMFSVFGTKERTVLANSYKPKINTFHAMLQIYRNKYWWIRNISAWIGFFETACMVVFQFLFIYEYQRLDLFAAIVVVNGTAGLIAMVFTPMITKKIGNRNFVLIQNFLNIFAIIGLLFTYKMIFFLFLFNYINLILNNSTMITDPVMHAEVKDYQQYLSGKRYDFLFGTAGIIAIPITIATGYALPFVFEFFGFTNNEKIFFDPIMRDSLFRMLFILSAAGAFLNLAPLFFYDLTNSKHRNIVSVLKIRALFSDNADGTVTAEQIKNCVDDVRVARVFEETEKPDTKEALREFKRVRIDLKEQKKTALEAYLDEVKLSTGEAPSKDELKKFKHAQALAYREEVKAAFKRYLDAVSLKENIIAAGILMSEMRKFSRNDMILKTELASALTAKSFDEIKNTDPHTLSRAKLIVAVTPEDKKLKRIRVSDARRTLSMAAKIKSKYPAGLEEYDMSKYDTAVSMPHETKAERKAKVTAVRGVQRELNRYNNTVRHFIESKDLVEECENYKHFDTIEARYEDACAEVAEAERVAQEKQEAQAAEKKAELERNRQEIFDRMTPEKQAKTLEKRAKKAAKSEEKARKLAESNKACEGSEDGSGTALEVVTEENDIEDSTLTNGAEQAEADANAVSGAEKLAEEINEEDDGNE